MVNKTSWSPHMQTNTEHYMMSAQSVCKIPTRNIHRCRCVVVVLRCRSHYSIKRHVHQLFAFFQSHHQSLLKNHQNYLLSCKSQHSVTLGVHSECGFPPEKGGYRIELLDLLLDRSPAERWTVRAAYVLHHAWALSCHQREALLLISLMH